jgi:hypothetical protein
MRRFPLVGHALHFMRRVWQIRHLLSSACRLLLRDLVRKTVWHQHHPGLARTRLARHPRMGYATLLVPTCADPAHRHVEYNKRTRTRILVEIIWQAWDFVPVNGSRPLS